VCCGTEGKSISLYNTIGNNLVFYFYVGARYRILMFGGPGNEVVTKKDYIPVSGHVSVGAPNPINIRVDYKLEYE
jgi:hypothetical protein